MLPRMFVKRENTWPVSVGSVARGSAHGGAQQPVHCAYDWCLPGGEHHARPRVGTARPAEQVPQKVAVSLSLYSVVCLHRFCLNPSPAEKNVFIPPCTLD